MELIKVIQENGEQLVSARELHKKLEITERFNSWFERMLKYGFIENVDYTGCKVFNALAKQELDEYILKLDMAKQICMLQRNEIGTKFRLYFIECEKQLKNQFKVPTTFKEALQLALEQQEKIEALQLENEVKEQQILEYKPKVEYLDTILNSTDTMTVTQIAADYGISGQKLNKILHEARIIRKVGGQWLLYTDEMQKGYTKSETTTIKIKDKVTGEEREKTVLNTKWTQKGRLKIHEILKSQGIMANIDKEVE